MSVCVCVILISEQRVRLDAQLHIFIRKISQIKLYIVNELGELTSQHLYYGI